MNPILRPKKSPQIVNTSVALLCAAGLACVFATSAAADPIASTAINPMPPHPAAAPTMAKTSTTSVQRQSGARTQVLNLSKGRSAVVDLPVDAADVFVSNPAAADAVLRTPRRIFVLGVESGQSDALFFDAAGRQILNLQIRVDTPTDELSETAHRLFPDSHVDIQSLNGHVILSGMARNTQEADQITRLALSFVTKPEDVLNLMSVAGKDQVTLKVRIVEVNHNTIKQLGLATDITYNYGTRSYSFGQTNSFGTNGSFLGSKGLCSKQVGAATFNGTNTITTTTPTPTGSVQDVTTNTGSQTFGTNNSSCLQAFERVGLARTLAEPNLTAVSGESARFLAGGEFPVPVGQDNQGRVTVEFKSFGVGLGFTPVVLSGGRISMKMSTEVSELTNTGSFSLNGTFTIPALNVRRAETTVEMQSGSSMMIAGLLQSDYKQSIDSLPGLTSLPVLGTLFRSRDFLNNETELVVIVTPYIVDPNSPDQFQTPADNLQAPNDMMTVFMGRLNRVIAASGKAGHGDDGSPSPPAGPYQAPVGYVIE